MDRFTQLPIYYQFGILVAIAAGLIGLFETVDFEAYIGLDLNPLMSAKNKNVELIALEKKKKDEFNELKQFRKDLEKREQDLKDAKAQLVILLKQVPNEKLTDSFLRTLEANALAAQIGIREIVSQPVVFKGEGGLYAELPFNVTLDGPYYNLRDYFERIGATDRITNVSGLDLDALEDTSKDYQYNPGSTVQGNVKVTTYYIPSEDELVANAPPAGK